jgi:hypothetical protein
MWPQVVSASTQELPSTLGAPLQCWGGPAKAARLHLSPYGRPSFNMAAVGRMPAATGAVRGCSDGSCPENFRTTSTSSSSTIVSNPGPSFTASEGAQPPLGLELSDPLSLPPREHVLTWVLSYPHRSLDHRQHRHRPLRLDGRRSCGPATAAAAAATDLSVDRRGVASEVRLAGASSHVPCMYMHLTTYDPLLTYPNDRRTALASRPHRPWPVSTSLARPRRRTGSRGALTARHERCHLVAVHTLTAHPNPLAGGPALASVAASGRSSTTGELGCVAASVAAVAGLSTAR